MKFRIKWENKNFDDMGTLHQLHSRGVTQYWSSAFEMFRDDRVYRLIDLLYIYLSLFIHG